MRLKALLVIWLLATSMAIASQSSTPAPVLFFSDLIIGTNTGNSDTTYSSTGGVYVTLYGNYLSSYSSITLGGSSCLTVVSAPATYLWYQRMVVKIGTTCSTGNFAVTTPGGTWSGPMVSTAKEGRTNDFTVVSGHIYYVSTSGNNSNAGTFSAPWAKVYQAQGTMADGDVTYVLNGYSDSSNDGEGGTVDPQPAQCAGGSPTVSTTFANNQMRAMVAYPGATVTLGSLTSGNGAFSLYAPSENCGGYELAEMNLQGSVSAVSYVVGGGSCPGHCGYNGRFVADILQCPSPGSGAEAGCFSDGGGAGGSGDPSIVQGIIEYGIQIFNTGNAPTNTLYHGEYHGTTASIMEAWGYIDATLNNSNSTPGVWNGIQMYTSNGSFVGYDYHIHDMKIADTNGSGILWGLNADPATTGTFGAGNEIYNDVLWNTGGGGDDACLANASDQPGGSATNNVYNNSMYNCGKGASDSNGMPTGYQASGCSAAVCVIIFNNNIIYMPNGGQDYVYNCITNCTYYQNQITGADNDFYGLSGSGIGNGWGATGTLYDNPQFVSTTSPYNFALQSSSPMIGAGTSTAPVATYDITGLLRPSPPSIGAYEYAAGTQVPLPSPPTNLQAVVE